MKIRLFTIPNIITLMNLLCGALAIIEVVAHKNFTAALWLLLAAALFDFFDGLSARALNQYSAVGVELDSLADMVSFGLAPAMVLYYMYDLSMPVLLGSQLAIYGKYLALIVAPFAALRLAKFNIDTTQSDEFSGMPTPAAALFVAALGYMVEQKSIFLSQEMILLTAVALALLMVSNIPMLALKFKGLALKKNALRYGFMLASALLVVAMGLGSIVVIFLLYLFVALVQLIARRRA